MTWPDFYLFCFLFGFFFSIISLVSGHLHLDWHDQVDFGDTGHVTHDGHHAGHHEPSLFNMGTISAFLAWFGGAGYLATHYYRVWVIAALGMSVAAGIIGASVVFWFLSKVLMREREDLDPLAFEMVGVLGSVSGSVRPGGTGEMLFSQNGARRAAPIRSEDGSAIPTGTEVVVTRYRDGIAYVRRWDELTRAQSS